MLRYLAAALLVALAMSTPAKAVIVNAADVGASGTTSLQGYADIGVGGDTVSVTGLTASLFLEYTGLTNGGLTWNFDYSITNTSSGGTLAKLTSFGFATTPNVASGTSTGLFDTVTINPSFPNVMQAGQNIDICFAPDSGCQGGVGLLNGQTADGMFTLTFASALGAISLDQAFVRFQELTATSPIYNVSGASGVGISNNVTITPQVVPGPMLGAGLPGLLAAGLGLVALARRRRRLATS